MPDQTDDTIVDAEIVPQHASDDTVIRAVTGKELARTSRTVEVSPGSDAHRDWPAVDSLTVILPPALTPAETLTAFVPLPKWTWHKWMFDVSDAVHDGDRDTVQTLLDLGERKGFA